MKKRICVLTATRAEYGLLRPIISCLVEQGQVEVRIAVTGMHLSAEFGSTYQEIEADGYPIDTKIDMLLSGDRPAAITKSMALAMIGFSDYFAQSKPDLLIVLGDRYETLAVCTAAMNERIPIAHLYGGEATEGAMDECIRHAITKMSYLHFTSTESYRKRVIQLGEAPERVFTVGATGIENIKTAPLLTKDTLEQSIGWRLDKPYGVVTFHPVTLEAESGMSQIGELLKALEEEREMQFIITKANADADGRTINRQLENFAKDHFNVILVDSLGMLRYLSALKYCAMVIGNSSSGILEAPSFQIPTINIGDRQKGRIQAETILNCKARKEDISNAIAQAKMEKVLQKMKQACNPYGDGNTSQKVVSILMEFLEDDKIQLKKTFYDLNPIS